MAELVSGCFKDGEDWLLSLRIQPSASRNGFAGAWQGHQKLAVKARAVDGAANAAVIAFLSDCFKVPKSRVLIEKGQLSRIKRVRVIQARKTPPELIA